MKKYAVGYYQDGILMAGEILAESQDHAEEICHANGWEYEGELIIEFRPDFEISDAQVMRIKNTTKH